ncbi:MAG: hypothetical protein L6R39_007776 [Caloplaca ligustica]|nr:MAG: hypothetical protein L6R39_007776 [Caloplaca ligustica]
MKLEAFLSACALIWAAACHVLPNTHMISDAALSKRASITKLYQRGRYRFAFAESDDHRQKVALMNRLLDNLYANLQPVLADLQAPSPPSPAYTTFFKDPASKPFLITLLNNITAGAPVYAPATQGWVPYSDGGSPVFWGVTHVGEIAAHIDGKVQDMYTRCLSNPDLTAAVLNTPDGGSPFVILCPFFFSAQPPSVYGDLPIPAPHTRNPNDQPPSPNCLTVNPVTEKFRKTTPGNQRAGAGLTNYRTWVVLEELVHLYLGAATGSGGHDYYDVNTCLRLSTQDALANGPTYARTKKGIAGKCQDFPSKSEGRELLEDPDDPADFGNDDSPTTVATEDATRIEILTGGQVALATGDVDAGSVETEYCAAGTCFTYCICA